ncbi:MAG: phage antirepressor N-terminal domain-containing protein [Chloroflexota bacterium]
MMRDDSQPTTAIEVQNRKTVEVFGDTLTAAQMSDGSIYLPLRVLCETLGLDRAAQVRRIKRDEALREDLHEFLVETETGPREAQFLRLEVVPYWLSGVTISKVKPELRDKLLAYKRWVVRKVYEAFMSELGNEIQPSTNMQNLTNLRELGLALAQLAEEQMALEHRQQLITNSQHSLSQQQDATASEVAELKERINNASTVVGKALARIKRLEDRTAAGIITEEQASEISLAVKQVAGELARREQKESNPYQRVFQTLYQRYGVSSYKQIPAQKFSEAMGWLNEWYQSLLPNSGSES